PVNDAPVAQALSGEVSEDGPPVLLTPSYSDVDPGESLVVNIDTTGTKGKVTWDADGTFG
ncbi:Ig-like domain-containing protein, partial [Rhizobium ruizarguesonis]